MKMSWRNPLSALIDRAVLAKAPKIARDAVEHASAQLKHEARQEVAIEVVRSMNAQLQAQVPQGYPSSDGSPHPLYGYDYPWKLAVPQSPKRRPDSLVDIDTMRRFANNYDILRSCINHLKREVQAQAFNIRPKDANDKSKSTTEDIKEANLFFSKQGGLGEVNETRRTYEAKLVEDVMVVGAYASWKSWSKGGQLLQVLNIDASTIRPKMDAYGWPGPGEDWYEQWVMGMLITGFQPHEMSYTGLWPETNSPFFRSAVEYLITTTLSALKADEWNRTWLTDGNTPGQAISLPEEWDPGKIKAYAEWFLESLQGDSRKRQQVVFLPGGAKEVISHSRKDQDFAEYELWLARRTGAITGVQLASIGFAGEQYKVSQDNSQNSTSQFGAGALLDLRKEHYDEILVDLGFPHLEAHNGETAEESKLERAQRLLISTGNVGWDTINEARAEEGKQPIENGDQILVPVTLQTLANAQVAAEPTSAVAKETDIPSDQPDGSEDLGRWMRKATKRVKDGHPALCTFASELISPAKNARIMRALGRCQTQSEVKAVFRAETDDEDSEDDSKPDKKKLWALLVVQIDEAEKALGIPAQQIKDGSIGITNFVNQSVKALAPHHIEAAHLGRIRAGGKGPISPTDIRIGTENAKTQLQFLQKLAVDLQSGQISDAQLEQRLKAFAQRIVGTANQSWVKALPQDASIIWNDEDDASECEDCHQLAENGPYTPETIPTLPGLAQTECRINCRCWVTTEDGETSFYDPNDHE